MSRSSHPTIGADLEAIDAALIGLRRFVAGDAPERLVEGASIDLSTVLVVDAVARLGGRAGIGDLAAELRVAPATATRSVDRAERAGMVRRGAGERDARRVEVALTEAGRHLDARALDFRVGRLGELLVDWPPDRIACFARDLAEFADAAEAARREEET